MAFNQLVPEQTWPIGITGPSPSRNVPANVDSIELRIIPDLANWTSDQASPPASRRTVQILVEQSLDGGTIWQEWGNAVFRTGPLPRLGVNALNLVITAIGNNQTRVARASINITNGSVLFGIDVEIRRET